jgi:DNA-binding LytR/AlgR family response regulator
MTKCIIVDDERPARELIQLHLSGLRNFSLSESFENAVEAFNFIQQNKVDLIFLDIQMPKISGLKLIKSLKIAPKIILTTAYREYAVEAFELDALDYMVKPITQERFMKAISKFNYYHNTLTENLQIADNFKDAYIFLKTGTQQTKIYLKDIIYIEGLKDYVKVHTHDKVLLASERLSYMEQKLPENKFSRIHKSFIVALPKITHYTSEQITIGNTTLPIGRVFKNEFLKKL